MGINLKRYPEYGVTLLTFGGKLGVKDLVELIDRLDRRDRELWLSYGDPTLDLSGIDVAHLPELKKVIASKQREIFSDTPPRNAMVYSSRAGEVFMRFWQKYAIAGDIHPMTPTVFSDLKAACDWLGLPEAARAEIEADIDVQGAPAAGGLRGEDPSRQDIGHRG